MKPMTWVARGLCALLATGAVQADQTFIVENKFSSTTSRPASYFGSQYDDSQIWLLFQNSAGLVTYTEAGGGSKTVTDGSAIALSAIQGGSFNVGVGANSTKVYAALSSAGTNPYAGIPDPFSVAPPSSYAYATAEFTYLGNSFDTADTTYIDTFAYPTKLTTSTSGTVVGTSSWKPGTQAQQVVETISQVMPSGATSRIATSVSSTNSAAERYVGTSLHIQTAVNTANNPNATVSSSGPGYNDYLTYLKDHTPQQADPGNAAETISGWYLDYSGNGGYSGYLQVTGTSGNYGLQITNVRANTGSGGGVNTNTEAGRALGTAVGGTITVASNGQQLTLVTSSTTIPTYTMEGQWTDMVIASGDQLYTNNGSTGFAAGPVVTTTGELAPGQAFNSLASTFLATVSATMSTGLLGSDTFGLNPSSNYWFGLDGVKADTALFSSLWSNLGTDVYYWDPYLEALVGYNDWEGYSFPFQDRFSALPGTALNLTGVDTMTWELGLTTLGVPEPTTFLLVVSGACGILLTRRRRRR
jgi:hypothetical protein